MANLFLAKRCAVPRGGKPLPVAWDRRKVVVDTIDAVEVLRKENRSPAIQDVKRGKAKNSQGQRDKVHGKVLLNNALIYARAAGELS
jgi:hypothetical protein